MPGALKRLLLGDGRLRPALREALGSEGIVWLEEGLDATISYHHFKAPGRRHHGKITSECVGLGISEERVVIYARWGRVKLADSPFSSPRWRAAEISEEDGKLVLRVDYDRLDDPETARVSGQITIRIQSEHAERVVAELKARIGP